MGGRPYVKSNPVILKVEITNIGSSKGGASISVV